MRLMRLLIVLFLTGISCGNNNILFESIDNKDLSTFRKHIDSSNSNMYNKEGETVLTYLLSKDYNYSDKKLFMDILFDNGANPDLQNKYGFTPLHINQYDPGLGVTSLLVRNKADINKKDFSGNTYMYNILICEAEEDNEYFYKNIDYFVSNGGNLNSVNNNGDTVLMNVLSHTLMARHDFSELIVYLYKKGSALNIRNKKNETALSISSKDRFSSKRQTNTLSELGARE